MNFKSATEAFEYYLKEILINGVNFSDTKTLFNVGFLIEDPSRSLITTPIRKFSLKYAQREWEWYLSGNKNAEQIASYAPIWLDHMDEHGNVNSNYGWQWRRENQLEYVIEKLKKEPTTRHAVISIYDAKEHSEYKFDTPCTLSIHFQIHDEVLNMTVNMRSNDLWYGFCNDQYQFSNLLQMVAKEVGIGVGTYYHFASNFHLYNQIINKQKLWKNLNLLENGHNKEAFTKKVTQKHKH